MWIVIAGAIALSSLTATETYDLKLKVNPDVKHKTALSAELADLLLSGTSMGVTGSFKAVLELTVLKADDPDGSVRVQILVRDSKVVFDDAEQSPPTIPPMILELDRHGRVLKLEGLKDFQALDMMSAGGIPVVLLAGVACIARLPDHPVAVGDTWEIEDQQPTPFGVAATTHVKMTLASVKDGKARLEGEAKATCPEFQAPNPMQPGMDMDVKDTVIRFTHLVQVVDLDTGLVDEAAGRFELSITADMQGVELPAKAYVDFASAQEPKAADKKLAQLQEKIGQPESQAQAQQPKQQAASGEKAQGQQQAAAMAEVGEQDFDEKVLKADRPVLVEFWAAWCGPCARQRPVVEQIARDYSDAIKVAAVDADKAAGLVERYSVEALPTLIIFKDGKEVWRAVGLQQRQAIAKALDKILGRNKPEDKK